MPSQPVHQLPGRTSTALLLSVPLADLVLIILVGHDLSRGSEPTSAHGLAAVYLGFSVGFGHYIISRADAWFAHRFAAGPRPTRPPRTGPAKVRHEWQDLHVRVINATTGEILRELTIEPDRDYQPQPRK